MLVSCPCVWRASGLRARTVMDIESQLVIHTLPSIANLSEVRLPNSGPGEVTVAGPERSYWLYHTDIADTRKEME